MVFGLPIGGFIGWAMRLDGGIPPVLGLFMGLGAGLAFGVVMTGFLQSIHRRMGLTPWDQLDVPSQADPPEWAEDFRTIKSRFMARSLLVGQRFR